MNESTTDLAKTNIIVSIKQRKWIEERMLKKKEIRAVLCSERKSKVIESSVQLNGLISHYTLYTAIRLIRYCVAFTFRSFSLLPSFSFFLHRFSPFAYLRLFLFSSFSQLNAISHAHHIVLAFSSEQRKHKF